MTERINYRDWKQISDYFDPRIASAEKAKISARRQEDPVFEQSLEEVQYIRYLLASLPKKRAPRNFTLSAETVKAPRKALWLQPALSFVSVAAMLALVTLFSFNFLNVGKINQANAPEMARMVAETADIEPAAPMIIQWNAYPGMGGGGGMTEEGGYSVTDGLGGATDFSLPSVNPEDSFSMGGGGPVESPEQTLPDTEEPIVGISPELKSSPFTAESTEDSDLSRLILGVPNQEEAGTILRTVPTADQQNQASYPLSSNNLWMALAGVIALLAGVGALLLRKV